ncbi:DUF2637 domain-containing protein [Kitasatospora aureofaciens]|uniref:DUF2637 domain-containing protein n=1 Tax=Kitasatospora aureofaciens TaxID=1894 RepID=UPI001C45E53F|nr:DUF2637 domain-containing protein [Kitasatospora aureofaciens]MBV6702178.1 DUF2637 domain-containing protein [Kitasatospora aureofaciens]
MARPTLTKAHRSLLGIVAAGACIISGIGFAGSYNAVRELAAEKGFGTFAYAFPIGVDAGIVVLLALDLVLTWLRIPFPLLRQTAWLLTVATIAFNAAASWGDPLGMGMHAVIPVLFVVVVEASRHAVGRIAAITADRHMESVRMMRWLLSPVPTFRLWRRMKLWELRSYDEVVRLEQNRLVYRAQLRFRYGRGWRRSAPIQALLPLKLAKYGVPLDPALLDRLDDEAREREATEVRELQLQDHRAAAAIAPAGPAGPAVPVQPQPVGQVQPRPQQQAQPPQAQPPQAQALQAQPQETQPEPAAVPLMSAEVAAPMLAKLAAVRLRAAQEPEGVAEEAPQSPREELNVWTARPVRTTGGHQTDATPAGRVPGQASPWFKPPRPAAEEEPAPQPAPQPGPQQQPQPLPQPAPHAEAHPAEPTQPQEQLHLQPPVHSDEPGPRPAPARLDPELAFEALVSYIDTFEHQPDPQRLAEWLTTEYGVTGNRPDGSVHPKDVAALYPQLSDRYAAAGRE